MSYKQYVLKGQNAVIKKIKIIIYLKHKIHFRKRQIVLHYLNLNFDANKARQLYVLTWTIYSYWCQKWWSTLRSQNKTRIENNKIKLSFVRILLYKELLFIRLNAVNIIAKPLKQ